jgi:hypothetical protein
MYICDRFEQTAQKAVENVLEAIKLDVTLDVKEIKINEKENSFTVSAVINGAPKILEGVVTRERKGWFALIYGF